jgi:pimeloyl-ACP methyl ester carboxylesterase
VADAVEQGPGQWIAHAGRVILFVHGYNNTFPVAREAYDTFSAGLAARAQDAASEIFDPLYRFYWPGDEDLGILSFMSYPVETEDAKASASRLVEFLRDLYSTSGHPARPIDIVSHSLGGRVVLETLAALAQAGILDGVLKRVCLMAPAVLVEHVEPGGELYDGATLPESLTILTSEDDWVLWLAFPLGQTMAEGGSGCALGRYGPPPGLPARHEPVSGGVGHTDYWECPDSVARVIIDALGFTPRRRELVGRSTPERETALSRTIEGREVGRF